MAYSEEDAALVRKELSRLKGVTEKKMFGGLCFLLHGNMVCGVHQGGAMARVGKEQESVALEYEGLQPLSFTGRPMGGMVELDQDALHDSAIRKAVISLAKKYVKSLPAK